MTKVTWHDRRENPTIMCAGFILVAVAGSLLVGARGYTHGDAVSMVLRTQHAGWRSSWSDVLRSQMPRFGVASAVDLSAPLPRPGVLEPDEPLKISLAFADSQVVVPWVPIIDGDGSRLETLTLTFVCDSATGDEIARVKWEGEYSEHAARTVHGRDSEESGRESDPKLHVVTLRYEWEETLERDLVTALVALIGGSLVMAVLVVARLCDDPADQSISGDSPAPSRRRATDRRYED